MGLDTAGAGGRLTPQEATSARRTAHLVAEIGRDTFEQVFELDRVEV